MNAFITDPSDPSFVYYDSDYPSSEFPVFPENLDSVFYEQGIANDINLYKRLVPEYGNNVLELCCGTGRIAIPLALMGCQVTAVDIAAPLLRRFKTKIEAIPNFPHSGIAIIKQDVTTLRLEQSNFDAVICGFNSLLCITDFDLQLQTLIHAGRLLRPGGLLTLDVWNPLRINLQGDEIPEFFFTRRRVDNGNHYTRFAATGPVGTRQVQSVYGWYDETDAKGVVTRSTYSLEWRLIFPKEVELLLEKAGFKIINIYGGNLNESFQRGSLKMFVTALKL